MFTADQFRAKAQEYDELLKNTDNPSEMIEFQRSKQSFSQLAHNEDWLAANFDKIIHSHDGGKAADRRTVAEIEEHILRCLGAALIMQWAMVAAVAFEIQHRIDHVLQDTGPAMAPSLVTWPTSTSANSCGPWREPGSVRNWTRGPVRRCRERCRSCPATWS